MENERTITRGAVILEGVQAHQGHAPHGGPLDGSAYPQPRRSGRGVPRLFPSPGLLHLPSAPGRLDRLPRPAHPQRGLAGHRPGRQTPPRYRLRRVPFRELGVGRPGDRPGHLDPDTSGPRRGRLGGRRRHPLSQAWGQGRLRRHLPRRGPLLEKAQDIPVRPELGRARGRRADPDASRSLLLPAGALAALPQEGTEALPDPSPGCRGAGADAGRGPSRPHVLAGRRQRLHQCGDVAGPAEEPPGDRANPLEGGTVWPARAASAEAEGSRRGRRGIACRTPRR